MKGKQPHEQLTTNDNGLKKMQEVTYRKEFKEMDSAANSKNNQNQDQNQNKKYNL